MSPDAWLEANRELWAMVLPVAAVTAVMAVPAGDDWSKVREELHAIQASSVLGRRLFAWASTASMETGLDEAISKSVTELLAEDTIDAAVLRKHIKQCKEVVDSLPGVENLPDRREATVQHRSFNVKLQAKSVAELIDWACRAAVRGRAAEAGCLQLLVGESIVCQGVSSGSKAKVNESLVLKPAAARQYLKDKLEVWSTKGGEAVEDRRKI